MKIALWVFLIAILIISISRTVILYRGNEIHPNRYDTIQEMMENNKQLCFELLNDIYNDHVITNSEYDRYTNCIKTNRDKVEFDKAYQDNKDRYSIETEDN